MQKFTVTLEIVVNTCETVFSDRIAVSSTELSQEIDKILGDCSFGTIQITDVQEN